MRRFWALCLVLLTISACVSKDYMRITHDPSGQEVRVVPIYIDDQFSEGDVTALQEAINEWNWALDQKLQLIVDDYHYHLHATSRDPGYMFIRITSKNEAANQDDTLVAYAFTVGVGGNRIYFVRDRIDSQMALKLIALHEIGHALGSNHLDCEACLMRRWYSSDAYRCIDQSAVLTVAKYQHLSTDGLRWCQR